MLRLLALAIFPILVVSQCQPGDYPFETNCFSFHRVQGSFDETNRICSKTLGGSLVKIINIIENNWIQKLAVDNLDADYDFFWTGGSDQNHVGDWRWTDGSPFNFTRWANGEPLEDRHCSTMQVSTGLWFTSICDLKWQFICQYPQNGGGTVSPFSCPPCPTCSN
uniref:C-type lectin domain-containing protein n=1 Tax=Caenorhabditis japonica TaxID=281687 RepID=A0A8R1DU97_CAEJA